MQKILLICLACLTLVPNAAGQEKANYQSADELQREVTFLLLDKNINDVMRQLDSENASTVGSLLRSQMKKEDPLSTTPDLALRLLQ